MLDFCIYKSLLRTTQPHVSVTLLYRQQLLCANWLYLLAVFVYIYRIVRSGHSADNRNHVRWHVNEPQDNLNFLYGHHVNVNVLNNLIYWRKFKTRIRVGRSVAHVPMCVHISHLSKVSGTSVNKLYIGKVTTNIFFFCKCLRIDKI